MTLPPRARWRALPRVLRWPLLAFIALYASYLLLGNLLLNTRWGRLRSIASRRASPCTGDRR